MSELTQTPADAAAERRCQCRQLPGAGLNRGHDHAEPCARPYDTATPLNGLLFCMVCLNAEFRDADLGRRG